jgi:predicted amidohydrolase YtcJ
MSTFRTFLVCVVLAGLAGSALPAQTGQPPTTASSGARVFYGNIRTMDDKNTMAQAVAVDAQGVITYVGTAQGAEKAAGAGFEKVQLAARQTLLPGFIDAHMHVVAQMQQKSGLIPTVGACPPTAYTPLNVPPRLPEPCYPYIKEALQFLKPKPPASTTGSAFITAMFLDPSRQPYDAADKNPEAMKFKKCPSQYIEENTSENRPVVIVDQSGHFGYVNRRAFEVLRAAMKDKGQEWPPVLPDGGEWNVNDPKTTGCDPASLYEGKYTGLLTEPPGYAPFYELVMANTPKDAETAARLEKGAVYLLDDLRQVGFTTVVTFSETEPMLNQTVELANRPDSGTRMLSVVPPELATKKCETCKAAAIPGPIPPKFENGRLGRDLGVNGIKTMADGSTQGCSAGLSETPPGPQYQGLPKGECAPADGRMNYTTKQLTDLLRPLWKMDRWRFETHANGNRGIEMALGIYAQLQSEDNNSHTATIIHGTVGDEATWEIAGGVNNGTFQRFGNRRLDFPRVKLHFSHLIGHVAYWGAVFERQLGNEAAGKIVPVLLDRKEGIPFSLHSDAPVSVPNPLWYIRQAVTRETWQYPQFPDDYKGPDENKSHQNNDKPHVLGPIDENGAPKYAATVLEALRAVTINAAREKELDKWIGSIEVGKVADFAVLSDDPMEPKKGLSDITVVSTYLGGQITDKK